jgi:hypothetical protein
LSSRPNPERSRRGVEESPALRVPHSPGPPATGLRRWGGEALFWLEWDSKRTPPTNVILRRSRRTCGSFDVAPKAHQIPVEAWGFSPTKNPTNKQAFSPGLLQQTETPTAAISRTNVILTLSIAKGGRTCGSRRAHHHENGCPILPRTLRKGGRIRCPWESREAVEAWGFSPTKNPTNEEAFRPGHSHNYLGLGTHTTTKTPTTVSPDGCHPERSRAAAQSKDLRFAPRATSPGAPGSRS